MRIPQLVLIQWCFLVFGLFYTQNGAQAGQCPANPPNFVVKQGYRLYGHVIYSLYAEKEVLCRLKCNLNERCLTFNFEEKSQFCELNDADYEKDLQKAQGFIYVDVKKKKSEASSTSSTPTLSRPANIEPNHIVVGHSCKEINDLGDSRGDGEYWIDPGNTGKLFTVYCDMTTDSGGWTLIKLANITSPNPNQFGKFDQKDYRGITNYSDIRQNPLVAAIRDLRKVMGFHQLRYRCYKHSTNRTLHIMTTNNTAGYNVLDHFLVKSTWPKACDSFERLPDDTSILAQNCVNWGYNKLTMVNRWGRYTNTGSYRLYNYVITWEPKYSLAFPSGGHYHCDDTSGTVSVGDIWELYVR